MRNCPKCNTPTRIADSRTHGDGFVKRRRVCPSDMCGHRLTTVEIPWSDDPRYAEQLEWVIGDE